MMFFLYEVFCSLYFLPKAYLHIFICSSSLKRFTLSSPPRMSCSQSAPSFQCLSQLALPIVTAAALALLDTIKHRRERSHLAADPDTGVSHHKQKKTETNLHPSTDTTEIIFSKIWLGCGAARGLKRAQTTLRATPQVSTGACWIQPERHGCFQTVQPQSCR